MLILHFVRASGLGADAIALYERSWPSHVDALGPDGRLLGARSDTIGGVPPGVQWRPMGYEKWSRARFISLSATDRQESLFWQFCSQHVGRPYDEEAILGFALGKPLHKEGSFICSGFYSLALTVSGWFPRAPNLPHEQVDPGLLLSLIWPWGR